jgi:hypothetical protein
MTPSRILEFAITPALVLLPAAMGSPSAMAMLLAIGLQESKLKNRHQIGGPAHSYWQFEQGGGVVGVLKHPSTKPHIQSVLAALDYDQTTDAPACYAIIEHNDILAASFARLLLWTLPQGLPDADDPEAGWQAYIKAWRPGKPHRETWDAYFEQAWQVVAEATKDN